MYNNQNMCCSTHNHSDNQFPIGMAYVPWQQFNNLYSPEKGLVSGTIFADLDKPFKGGCCSC